MKISDAKIQVKALLLNKEITSKLSLDQVFALGKVINLLDASNKLLKEDSEISPYAEWDVYKRAYDNYIYKLRELNE